MTSKVGTKAFLCYIVALMILTGAQVKSSVNATAGSGQNTTSVSAAVDFGPAGGGGTGGGGSGSGGTGDTSDSDGDGIPDEWERRNGTDPDRDDADEDYEPDGLINRLEYLSGTYPWNPYSDGDTVMDGEDGWALDKDLFPPRLPETRYAIIDLDELGFGDPVGVNSSGHVLDAPVTGSTPYRLWKNGAFLSVPMTFENGSTYWGDQTGFGRGPSESGHVLGYGYPGNGESKHLIWDSEEIWNTQLGAYNNWTFTMTRSDRFVGTKVIMTGPSAGVTQGVWSEKGGTLHTIGSTNPVAYPCDINANEVSIGRYSAGAGSYKTFIDEGAGVVELPFPGDLDFYGSEGGVRSLNNLTSPWVVGTYQNNPKLLVKVAGNWKHKDLVVWDAPQETSITLQGDARTVNDRCEILGSFGLIRNGRLVDFDQITDDYSFDHSSNSYTNFHLTNFGIVLTKTASDDDVLLVPTEISTKSKPYSDDGTQVGPINNIISTWPGVPIELFVDLKGLDETTTLPSDFIKWTVPGPGNQIPVNQRRGSLIWSTPGTRQILIEVGGTKFRVVIDVPDVGPMGEEQVALTNPVAAFFAKAYANDAQGWAAGALPGDSNITDTLGANALTHSYWNALMASDSLVGSAWGLQFSTAHEFNNWAIDHGDAFDSTMDLHNNFIGSLETHSILGIPNYVVIRAILLARLKKGDLWIVPHEFAESEMTNHISGHVIKSNHGKIFPLE